MQTMVSNVENKSEYKVYERKYRPEMSTAFEIRRNPLADNLEDIREWIDWTFDISLMAPKKFTVVQSCYAFANHTYANCTDLIRFECVTKLIVLTGVWDDHSEESDGEIGRSAERCRVVWLQFESALDYLNGKACAIPMNMWKPYTYAMYTLFECVYNAFNEEQKRRFISVWKDWIIGSLRECEVYDSVVKITCFADILSIKRQTVAILGFVQLLEYSDDICLTDGEWNDPTFQELLVLTTDCIIYTNDLYSFEKEYVEQGSRRENLLRISNTVAITAGLTQCSIAEAMDVIIKRYIEVEVKTLALMKEITERPGIRPELKCFIKTIDCFIGGNLKASQVIDRYNIIDRDLILS